MLLLAAAALAAPGAAPVFSWSLKGAVSAAGAPLAYEERALALAFQGIVNEQPPLFVDAGALDFDWPKADGFRHDTLQKKEGRVRFEGLQLKTDDDPAKKSSKIDHFIVPTPRNFSVNLPHSSQAISRPLYRRSLLAPKIQEPTPRRAGTLHGKPRVRPFAGLPGPPWHRWDSTERTPAADRP